MGRAERRRMKRAGITPPPTPMSAEAGLARAQARTRDGLRYAVTAWAAITPATELVHDLDVDEVDVMEGGQRDPVDRIRGIPTLTTPTITTVAAFTPTGKPITVAITATITPR